MFIAILVYVCLVYVAFPAPPVLATHSEAVYSMVSSIDAVKCAGGAQDRIDGFKRLLERGHLLREEQETEMLREVNLFYYRNIRMIDDRRVWSRDDYWASLPETLCMGTATARTSR